MKKVTSLKKEDSAETPKKKKMGRPVKLTREVVTPRALKALAHIGARSEDIRDIYGISIQCFQNFLARNPDLLETLRKDKAQADGKVEASLYMKALGFTHQEEKVFYNAVLDKVVKTTVEKYYPPSDLACIFWLKNRQPDKWRELQNFAAEVAHKGEVKHTVTPEEVSDEHRRRIESNLGIVQRYGILALPGGQTPN